MGAIDEQVLDWTARTEEVPLRQLVAVPVDVGKSSAMVMACDFSGRTIMPAVEFPLTRAGVVAMLAGLRSVLPADVRLVRVGVEAAGHYHQPMIAPEVWPQGWQVLEHGAEAGPAQAEPRAALATELLQLCERFFTTASPAVVAEGVHLSTALGWFTDSRAFATYHPEPGE